MSTVQEKAPTFALDAFWTMPSGVPAKTMPLTTGASEQYMFDVSFEITAADVTETGQWRTTSKNMRYVLFDFLLR
jgi:hypothetical protein